MLTDGLFQTGLQSKLHNIKRRLIVYICVQIPLAAYTADSYSRRGSRNRRSCATAHEDTWKIASHSVAGESTVIDSESAYLSD